MFQQNNSENRHRYKHRQRKRRHRHKHRLRQYTQNTCRHRWDIDKNIHILWKTKHIHVQHTKKKHRQIET